jgi:acid phosphatase family membrane protein YuiD
MIEIRIFIAVLGAAIISQSLKVFLNIKKDKKGIALTDLVVTGGMPSTHATLVSSLFAILLFETGLSAFTLISFVLFVVVITDSMGVRRTAGEEAKMLNKIIKMEKLKIHKLHYALGHRPIEVLAGIALGFLVAVLSLFINVI